MKITNFVNIFFTDISAGITKKEEGIYGWFREAGYHVDE